MAKFRSDSQALVLEDADGVWAEFTDHSFETSDKKVIERLKGVEGVSEDKSKGDSESPEG